MDTQQIKVSRTQCLVTFFQSFKHSQDLVNHIVDSKNGFLPATVKIIVNQAFDEKSASKIMHKYMVAKIDQMIVRKQDEIKMLVKERDIHHLAIKRNREEELRTGDIPKDIC